MFISLFSVRRETTACIHVCTKEHLLQSQCYKLEISCICTRDKINGKFFSYFPLASVFTPLTSFKYCSRGNETLQNTVVPLKFCTRASFWVLLLELFCVRFLSVTETHYRDGELQQFRLRPTAGYLKQCELEHSYLSRGWTAITPSATEERKRRGIKGNEQRGGNEEMKIKTTRQENKWHEMESCKGRGWMCQGKERKGKDERRPGDSQLYYTSLESPNWAVMLFT